MAAAHTSRQEATFCGAEFNTVFRSHRSPASEWSIAAVADTDLLAQVRGLLVSEQKWRFERLCKRRAQILHPGARYLHRLGYFAGTTAPAGSTGAVAKFTGNSPVRLSRNA